MKNTYNLNGRNLTGILFTSYDTHRSSLFYHKLLFNSTSSYWHCCCGSSSIFTLFLSHAAAMFFHILYICVLESFPRFSPFFSFSSFLFLSLSLSLPLSLSPVIHCDFARPRKICCLLFKGEQNDRNGNCFVSYSVPDIKTYCPICVLSIRIYYI